MDPQIEYLGEDNKYGVTKSDAAVPEGEDLNTPVQTETKTTSRGLFGLGVSALLHLGVPTLFDACSTALTESNKELMLSLDHFVTSLAMASLLQRALHLPIHPWLSR